MKLPSDSPMLGQQHRATRADQQSKVLTFKGGRRVYQHIGKVGTEKRDLMPTRYMNIPPCGFYRESRPGVWSPVCDPLTQTQLYAQADYGQDIGA